MTAIFRMEYFTQWKIKRKLAERFLNGWLEGWHVLVRIFQAHRAVQSAQKEYWEEITEVVIHERNGPKSNCAWIYAGKMLFSKTCCFHWKKNPFNASNGQCSCVRIVDIFHHFIGSITTFLKLGLVDLSMQRKLWHLITCPDQSITQLSILQNPLDSNPRSNAESQQTFTLTGYYNIVLGQFTAGHTNFGEEQWTFSNLGIFITSKTIIWIVMYHFISLIQEYYPIQM